MRSTYKMLAEKSAEKSPLARHRHRWEDNIKIGGLKMQNMKM
jgi:hypothetical protein